MEHYLHTFKSAIMVWNLQSWTAVNNSALDSVGRVPYPQANFKKKAYCSFTILKS